MEAHAKEGQKLRGRKNEKGIENTREENRNNLLMSKGTQRKYERVKPENIVKSPGQGTKTTLAEHLIIFEGENEM